LNPCFPVKISHHRVNYKNAKYLQKSDHDLDAMGDSFATSEI
jgi:hypothetical protein